MAINPADVDVAGMRGAQPHFEQALTDTSSAYSNMESQRQALAASWQGDAAQGFTNALDAWLENCNTVRQQLNIVTEKLREHTGQYEQVHQNTSDSSTQLAQAVAQGLPGF